LYGLIDHLVVQLICYTKPFLLNMRTLFTAISALALSLPFVAFGQSPQQLNSQELASNDGRISINQNTNWNVTSSVFSEAGQVGVESADVFSNTAFMALSPSCGNGIQEAGETCDDGNMDDLDGCSATCQDESLPPPAPANDNVCNAIELTMGTFGPYYISNATVEVGEPLPPDGSSPPLGEPDQGCQAQDGWCINSGGLEPVLNNSVWYTFIGPVSGSVNLNTDGSTYDTQIAVYSGNNCNDILNGNGTFIGANDDNPDFITTQYSSDLTLTCLTPGDVYYVLIDGYDGAEGDLSITLTADPAATGTYPNTSVIAGQNTTVIPSAIPAGFTSLNAFADAGFTGILTVDPTTGVVSVTDALQAGIYTVTVTSPNGCVTASFTLSVTDPSCTAQYTETTVAVGDDPQGMAIGDFNNDGVQDLAICNVSDMDVSIRLGDGLGGFTSPADVPMPEYSYNIAIGDFNGDGNQDMAVSSAASLNLLSIRLGDGLGGFAGTLDISIGEVSGMVVGDFNSDGMQDLAASHNFGTGTQIYLGDGTGGFNSAPSVGVGQGQFGIAKGDFNGDGIEDLALGSNDDAWANPALDSYVDVHLGDGNSGFGPALSVTVTGSARLLAVGDFNEDGNHDLAITYGSIIAIHLGNGAGGFTVGSNTPIGANPQSIAVGDFNGDGTQDLAIANAGDDDVSIRLGDGAGGFTSPTDVTVGDYPRSIAIGDFNGDGMQDFATVNRNDDNVSIRLGEAVSITGATEVSVGSSITLTGNGTAATIDPWVSSNTGIATISSSGEVTGIADGTVDITYTTESGCSATHAVTVNDVAPINDDLCDAIPLTVGANCSGFIYGNIDATLQAGEIIGCSPDVFSTVWFSFTAPASGSVMINTASEGPATIERALYEEGAGFDCADLSTLVLVECSNDDNNLNTTIVCGLTAGDNYFIRIQYPDASEDGNFCLEVSDRSPTVVVIDESCVGSEDGTITVNTTGGSGTFSYSLDSGTPQASNVFTGLGAGTYSITVIVNGVAGCAIASATLTPPPALTVSASVTSNYNGEDSSCNGSTDGEATAVASGGTGTITYLWSNGEQNAISTGMAPNTYNVTVTDANGCEATASVTITEPTAIAVTMSMTSETCATNDGTATAIPTGGTGAYTFLWDATAANQQTATAVGLIAGSYDVTVTDANGCFTTNSISVADGCGCPSPTLGFADAITDLAAQLNWTETGTATLYDIEFGVSGFSPTGTPTEAGVTNNHTIMGLTPLTGYDFYVRADCGGGNLSGFVGPFNFTTSALINDNICDATPLILGVNPTIDVTNAGTELGEPVPPVGTATDPCQSQDGWCDPAQGGGEPGLASTVWYTFVAPASGNVTLSTDLSTYDTQIAVYGGSCTDILAGNGTFIGANDDNPNWSNFQYTSEVTVTCLTEGETYFVQVDGWGTSVGDLTIEMTFNTYLVSAAITPTNSIVCDGIFETLSATIGADFTYLWTPGNEVAQSIDIALGGTYEVMVTDSNGCVATDEVIIGTETTPVSAYTQATNFLDAIFTNASTGTVDDYAWTFGDGNTSTLPSPTHTYATSNTYTVCLTVSNDCGDNTECQPVTVDILTGITEASNTAMLVYPNPTNGEFTIKVSGVEGKASLNLFDMAGRIVCTEAVVLTNNYRHTINTNFATGTYNLQMVSEAGVTNTKLEVR
jgi:cysteine-rich repeat protein